MLDNNKLNEIKRILSYSRLPIKPDTYSSKEKIRKAVLAEELQEELSFLTQLMESGGNFESAFRDRARVRSTDQPNYIGLFEDPDTLTNRLYWDIASIIEEPKNPQEMFAILHPELESVFSIDLDEQHVPLNAQERREFAKYPLIISQKPLRSLESIRAPKDLTHCIIVDKMLVDIRQVLSYSLDLQFKLYHELKTNYLKVYQALYRHNNSLVSLVQDHFLTRPSTAFH